MAFCPNCSRENSREARFCADCGTRLDVSDVGFPGSSGAMDLNNGGSASGSFYGLTRKSIWLMIGLTIITFGIYEPYWYLTRLQRFNALSSSAKFNQTSILIWLVWFVVDAIIIVFAILSPESSTLQSLELIEGIGNLVAAIFALILAFRAKKILQEHLAVNDNDYSMSGVATFFFQFFYIQYKINRLMNSTTPPVFSSGVRT